MTDSTSDQAPIDLSNVAEEPAEETVAEEKDIVGNAPDGPAGGIVPDDDAQ